MRRQLRTLLFTFLATLGIVEALGATYHLEQVTSVEAGSLYVFEQDGYVMGNTISSSALQTTSSFSLTGLTSDEIYIWTLESASGGFYMKNYYQSNHDSSTSRCYLNNTSSTTVALGSKNSIWKFTFEDDGTVLIQNTSNNNRFLGYTNATSHAYKAYATRKLDKYMIS